MERDTFKATRDPDFGGPVMDDAELTIYAEVTFDGHSVRVEPGGQYVTIRAGEGMGAFVISMPPKAALKLADALRLMAARMEGER